MIPHMPTVLRKSGYRFHFYSHEGKFWLDPVCLADNDGFSAHELQKIFALVKAHCDYLQNCYKEFHGPRTRHRRKKGER